MTEQSKKEGDLTFYGCHPLAVGFPSALDSGNGFLSITLTDPYL